MGLEQGVEDLEDDALVDGKLSDDVCQQQVAVVLGGWVLRREGNTRL